MGKIIENYSLHDLLGEGGYGKVYRALNFRTNQQFAIKVVPIVKFRENPKLQQCTVNQINTLSSIESSPHIVKYVEMLKTPNNFYFIYEYCNGGTLQKLMRMEGKLPQNKALLFFKQLVEAFKVLSKRNIMHRDLKPDNILFHNNVLKLGDFGFCKSLESGNQMTSTMLGSPIYMAPQVLKGEVYTSKADIWSLGVVLFEMLFGYCPFQSNSIAKLISVLQQNQVKFPSDTPISIQTQNLIKRLLVKDPFRRADWPEIFSIQINDLGYYEQGGHTDSAYPSGGSVGAKDFSVNKVSSGSNLQMETKSFTQSTGGVGGFKANFDRNKSATNAISNSSNVTSTGSTGSTGSFDKNLHFSVEATKSGLNANSFKRPVNLADNNNTNRRRQVIEEHGICAKAVKTALQVVRVEDRQTLGLSYIILKRVEERMKKVSDDINLTEIEFEDIVVALNNELRQLEREMTEIREQLSRSSNLDVKMLAEPKNFLRTKYKENEPQLKAWFDMVTFLFGEKDVTQPNKEYNHIEMSMHVKNKLLV